MEAAQHLTVSLVLAAFVSLSVAANVLEETAPEPEMCKVTWSTPTETIDFPDSIGDMQLIETTCGFPPQRKKVSRGEYRHYMPSGSRARISVSIYNDSGCVNGSLHLSDNSEEVLTWHTERMTSNSAVFVLDYFKPIPQIFVLCHCLRSDGSIGSVEPWFINAIGYKPERPKNFECIVTDFKFMHCLWDSQQATGAIWTFCYKSWKEETVNEPDTTQDFICEKSHSSSFTTRELNGTRYPFKFTIIINGTNDFGVVETTFKYEPIQERLTSPSLELSYPVGSRNVSLQWHLPCDISPIYSKRCATDGLRFNVTLSVLQPESTSVMETVPKIEHTIITSNSGVDKPYSIDIPDLTPYTTYSLRMVQSVGSDFGDWSEPTELTFSTDSALPDRGPSFHRNGFLVTDEVCPRGEYGIRFYWKASDVSEGANGLITSYSLQEASVEGYERQSAKCVSQEGEDIYIYAVNAKGKGIIPSLYITPPAANIFELPSGLIRACRNKLPKNSTTVDWRLLSDFLETLPQIKNATYTIFWCKHVDGHCQDEFDWLDIEAGSGIAYKSVSLKGSQDEYMYGVGVTYDSAMSGVIWARCLLGFTLPQQRDEDVVFSAEQYNLTHAIVTVTPQCIEGQRMIEAISLSYSDKANVSSEHTSIIPSFSQKVIYVEINHSNANHFFGLKVIYADRTSKKVLLSIEVEGEDNSKVLVICSLVSAGMVLVAGAVFVFSYIIRKRQIYRNIKVKTIAPVIVNSSSLRFDRHDGDSRAYIHEGDSDNKPCVYEHVPCSTSGEWLLGNTNEQELFSHDQIDSKLADDTCQYVCRPSGDAAKLSSNAEVMKAQEHVHAFNSSYISLAKALQYRPS